MYISKANWTVLLIGGSSGVGKSMIARQIGLRFGVPWLGVDDLRLAFQHSHVTLQQRTEDLYFFTKTPNVWRLEPEQLCDGLIATGEVMSSAIEIVVANHCDNAGPVIIEGDGILPSLFDRPLIRQYRMKGQVKTVFLVEQDENRLFANMLTRGRGITERPVSELHTEARAKWLYGQWLSEEARRNALPIIEPRPWKTLPERMVALLQRDH